MVAWVVVAWRLCSPHLPISPRLPVLWTGRNYSGPFPTACFGTICPGKLLWNNLSSEAGGWLAGGWLPSVPDRCIGSCVLMALLVGFLVGFVVRFLAGVLVGVLVGDWCGSTRVWWRGWVVAAKRLGFTCAMLNPTSTDISRQHLPAASLRQHLPVASPDISRQHLPTAHADSISGQHLPTVSPDIPRDGVVGGWL